MTPPDLSFCVFAAPFLRWSLAQTLCAPTLTFPSPVCPAVCLFSKSLHDSLHYTFSRAAASLLWSFLSFLWHMIVKQFFKMKHFIFIHKISHICVSHCCQVVLWIKHLSTAFFFFFFNLIDLQEDSRVLIMTVKSDSLGCQFKWLLIDARQGMYPLLVEGAETDVELSGAISVMNSKGAGNYE